MLFVTKDLREEREESTHGNILRDAVTLISFFLWKSWGVVDVNKSGSRFTLAIILFRFS
jgi:hypothetical protein